MGPAFDLQCLGAALEVMEDMARQNQRKSRKVKGTGSGTPAPPEGELVAAAKEASPVVLEHANEVSSVSACFSFAILPSRVCCPPSRTPGIRQTRWLSIRLCTFPHVAFVAPLVAPCFPCYRQTR